MKVKNGSRILYVAADSVESLSMQLELQVEEEISATELMKKTAKNPITGDVLPLLPATFVDPKHGTGVVMSVQRKNA